MIQNPEIGQLDLDSYETSYEIAPGRNCDQI
jgi:hypothetical protein